MPYDSADLAQFKALNMKLRSLNIYNEFVDDYVISKAIRLFESIASNDDSDAAIYASAALVQALIKEGLGLAWRDYLIYRIISSVNPFSVHYSKNNPDTKFGLWLTEAAALDLNALQSVAVFSLDKIVHVLRSRAIAEDKALVLQRLQDVPTWPTDFGLTRIRELLNNSEAGLRTFKLFRDSIEEAHTWQRLAKALAYFHSNNAYGKLCFNHVFRWNNVSKDALVPVARERQMQDYTLYDYTQTLIKLSQNTARFLNGRSSENALLYGPRGTGKSTSVRLMAQGFAKNGLRLIELSREQLSALPEIFSHLHALRMHFVIFIDDLSFSEMNDEYTLFKNILDGSVIKQPNNVLIYVTSNRRHLVSENFADTENALYANEVRSERLSLSERFGLRLRFVTPNKEDYLRLLHHVLLEKGITLSAEDKIQFEKAALSDSANEASMTPRNAVRFIREYLVKGECNVR